MTYDGRYGNERIDRDALQFHTERGAYNFAEAMTRIEKMVFCFNNNLPIPDFTKEEARPTNLPATPYFTEPTLKIVCSWCGKFMGTKPGTGRNGMTHSICPTCAAKALADDKGGK